MLWYVSAFFFLVWLSGKFLLHKGGFIHTFLLMAIGLFVAQFLQRRRTRDYERSLRR